MGSPREGKFFLLSLGPCVHTFIPVFSVLHHFIWAFPGQKLNFIFLYISKAEDYPRNRTANQLMLVRNEGSKDEQKQKQPIFSKD